MKHCKNKIMFDAYRDFRNTTATTLDDVYTHWSAEKEYAFDRCVELAHNFLAYDYGIISANTFVFTFGFCGFLEDREIFVFITPRHVRYIYLDELETKR